ncbi:unnamed protein product [Gadus morhua 'NCC']
MLDSGRGVPQSGHVGLYGERGSSERPCWTLGEVFLRAAMLDSTGRGVPQSGHVGLYGERGSSERPPFGLYGDRARGQALCVAAGKRTESTGTPAGPRGPRHTQGTQVGPWGQRHAGPFSRAPGPETHRAPTQADLLIVRTTIPSG